jgi:outer membrane lipoprotein LolB
MAGHSRFVVALLLAFACADAPIALPSDTAPCDSQGCLLTKTLGNLNLGDPIADLEKNLKGEDKRFIGINGYSCVAPGAENAKEPASAKFGIRCLEGTSDLVEGKAHEALIKRAIGYARTYNVELLRRIRAGLVT